MGGSSGKINEAAKAFVDENISNNKVVVFSKSYCPYCKMAKTSLSEVGLDAANYRVLELDQHRSSAYSSGDVQDYLQTISHISTVRKIKISFYSLTIFSRPWYVGSFKFKLFKFEFQSAFFRISQNIKNSTLFGK